MSRLMTKDEYEHLRLNAMALAEGVPRSGLKHELDRFGFLIRQLKLELPGNAAAKLSELEGAVRAACGQVKEKEHWIAQVKTDLYVFKSIGVERV